MGAPGGLRVTAGGGSGRGKKHPLHSEQGYLFKQVQAQVRWSFIVTSHGRDLASLVPYVEITRGQQCHLFGVKLCPPERYVEVPEV